MEKTITNENSGKNKLWLWVLMGIIAVIFIGAFLSSGEETEKFTLNNAQMNCEYNSLMDGWYVEISGTIKNNTNSNYVYVSVEFSLYDNLGNNLGTAMANMNNLGAGEIWRFKAESLEWFDEQVASCKLVDITYW